MSEAPPRDWYGRKWQDGGDGGPHWQKTNAITNGSSRNKGVLSISLIDGEALAKIPRS
jgi:hypothetical protein